MMDPLHPTVPDADVAPDALVAASAPRVPFSQRLSARLLVPLMVLFVAIVLVFFVLFDRSTISGLSMYPTLHDHDFVLLTRGLAVPKRGDVVILNVTFKGVKQEWVKRVIAIGGDTVDVYGDIIQVNGAPEQFPHVIATNGETQPREHLVVAPGQLFVAGDNRGISEDSRFVGTFAASAVRGKVVAVYAPIQRIQLVPGP
jgi:signal peptidase I